MVFVSSPEAPPSRRLRDVALRTGREEAPPTTRRSIMTTIKKIYNDHIKKHNDHNEKEESGSPDPSLI